MGNDWRVERCRRLVEGARRGSALRSANASGVDILDVMCLMTCRVVDCCSTAVVVAVAVVVVCQVERGGIRKVDYSEFPLIGHGRGRSR